MTGANKIDDLNQSSAQIEAEVGRWCGRVEALHLAPRSFLPMKAATHITLIEGVGVEGDRYAKSEGFYSDRQEPGRQVTLFEMETLEALMRDHNLSLTVSDHRRNITTRAAPLNHLVGKKFRIGCAVLEGTRLSTPCRHIEQITGLEVFDAMLNRSGLHAKIVVGGVISLGDTLRPY